MNRLGLFVAVFSIGFVLFLLVSDQLSRMFQEEENPFVEPDREIGSAADRNWVEFQCPDPTRGHLFTLRGKRENPGAMLLEQDSSLDLGNLVDAEVEFPGETGLEGGLKLTAERVEMDQKTRTLRLGGEIRAFRPNQPNEGEIETTNVLVDWSELADKTKSNGNFVLTGEEPLRLVYPALEVLGQSGFVGRLDESYRVEELRLMPPVLLALSPARGDELFGMSAARQGEPKSEPEENATAPDSNSRVMVHSAGPLILRQGTEEEDPRLVFEGVVHVWRVENYAGLSQENEIPESHFRCEKLALDLSRKAMQVERAIAWAGEKRLKFTLSDPLGNYVLTGDRLEWTRATGEARLFATGRIEFEGPWGEFEAGEGAFEVATRRIQLTNTVAARLVPARLGGMNSERHPRLNAPFEFLADRVDFTLAPETRSDPTHPITRLSAAGSQEQSITIREPAPAGIRLTGDRLDFNGETQELRLSSAPEFPGRRPLVREGGASLLSADVIRGSLSELYLLLEGSVEGHAVNLRQFETVSSTALSEPSPKIDDRAEIASETLRVTWIETDQGADLATLKLTGSEEKALTLSYEEGENHYRFSGDQLDWEAQSDELVLRGDRPQRLDMQDGGLEVSGSEIRAQVGQRHVRAMGSVEAIATREFLEQRGVQPPGREGVTEVRMRGEALDLVFAESIGKSKPTDRPGDTPETVPGDSADMDGFRFGLMSSRILSARLSSQDPTRPVRVSDGVVSLSGEVVAFDGEAGTATATGNGLQEITYQSEDGLRELRGRSIRVVPDGSRARVLIDGFDGELVQSSPREGRRAGRAPLVWKVTADAVEAWLSRRAESTDDEVRSRVELDEVKASGDLEVANAELQLSLDGDSATWSNADQCLRLFDSSGRGLQNLHHGPPEKLDEILARRVSVLVDPAASDRALILMEDVLNATLHSDSSSRDSRTPQSFQLETKQLLIRLTRSASGALSEDHEIDEATAWGGTTFKADDAQVLCDRVEYSRDKITFRGKPGQPPQIIKGVRPAELGDPMVYEFREGSRGRVVLPKGTSQQAAQDLTELLEWFRVQKRVPR